VIEVSIIVKAVSKASSKSLGLPVDASIVTLEMNVIKLTLLASVIANKAGPSDALPAVLYEITCAKSA